MRRPIDEYREMSTEALLKLYELHHTKISDMCANGRTITRSGLTSQTHKLLIKRILLEREVTLPTLPVIKKGEYKYFV